MKLYNLVTYSLFVVAMTLTPLSCAHLDAACAKALPVLAQGNGLVNEAQDALAQAQVAIEAIPDGDAKRKATAALAEARSALRVAESMLHASSEACSQPDLPGIFSAFAQAWEVIRTFLSTFGGVGGSPVADPKAYLLTK